MSAKHPSCNLIIYIFPKKVRLDRVVSSRPVKLELIPLWLQTNTQTSKQTNKQTKLKRKQDLIVSNTPYLQLWITSRLPRSKPTATELSFPPYLTRVNSPHGYKQTNKQTNEIEKKNKIQIWLSEIHHIIPWLQLNPNNYLPRWKPAATELSFPPYNKLELIPLWLQTNKQTNDI